jgi:glycosyltransferase involved in cell wall biosynthesis
MCDSYVHVLPAADVAFGAMGSGRTRVEQSVALCVPLVRKAGTEFHNFIDRIPMALRPLQPMSLPPLPQNPLVSVLIASHNYGRFIDLALNSLCTQTYSNFEVIVCDDGSSDDSLVRIDRVSGSDARFRVLTQERSGQAAALNAAFAVSKGTVVSLLDADDAFRPTKLERVVEVLRRGTVGGVLHAVDLVDGEGTVIGRIPKMGRVERGWIGDRVVKRGGRWRFLPGATISFRREVCDALFPIPDEFRTYGADAFLFTLLPLIAHIDYIDEPLAVYRRHGANASAREAARADGAVAIARSWVQITDLVNQRLHSLGFDLNAARLDPTRNLEYLQRIYVADLLNSDVTKLTLVRRLGPLARLVISDDLYTPIQKVGYLCQFLFAIALPARHRRHWLGQSWQILGWLHNSALRWRGVLGRSSRI